MSTIQKCDGGSGITKEVTGTTQVNILTEFFCTSLPPTPSPRSSMSSMVVAGFNKFSVAFFYCSWKPPAQQLANKQASSILWKCRAQEVFRAQEKKKRLPSQVVGMYTYNELILIFDIYCNLT